MSIYTWGQLKTDVRRKVFPTGEADNLVDAHDKIMMDAIVDAQTWVQCLQCDHIDIYPQCSTLYDCGLTVINPAPKGRIYRVTVVDSSEGATNYCGAVEYVQVDPIQIRDYLNQSQQRGFCLSIPWFFRLPFCGCAADDYPPVPTDEGLPAGLPVLPLGIHYPQASTDKARGRAFKGKWAIQHGRLYIVPWIQSTESILIEWDGVKEQWNDADIVDPDPVLADLIEQKLRVDHAKHYDRDYAAAQSAEADYNTALQTLIYNCRQQTRVRRRETSQSRASVLGLSTLYYNDQDASYTAQCPDGQTGDAVTVTKQAGTIGSNYSVTDANAKALAQAKSEAEAQLVCTAIPTVYYSSRDYSYSASCELDGTQEDGAPTPTGDGVIITVKAGTAFPTATSQAQADQMAQDSARAQAIAGLSCTYGNAPQTATKACSDGTTGLVSETVDAGQFTAADQSAADALAMTEAQNLANAAFDPTACPVPEGTLVYNTSVGIGQATAICRVGSSPINSRIIVNVTVPVHTVTEFGVGEANLKARNTAQEWANLIVRQAVAKQSVYCGQTITVVYPNSPHL